MTNWGPHGFGFGRDGLDLQNGPTLGPMWVSPSYKLIKLSYIGNNVVLKNTEFKVFSPAMLYY